MKKKAIVIYTVPEVLLHKQGKLSNDPDYSENGFYYWELPSTPKKDFDRIYFATKGFIRGYFELEDRSCESIEFNAQTWTDIKPIPQKPFQGFKYIDVED